VATSPRADVWSSTTILFRLSCTGGK
jgi:hypothetical protein